MSKMQGSPATQNNPAYHAACDYVHPVFLYEQDLSRDSSCNCPGELLLWLTAHISEHPFSDCPLRSRYRDC